MCSFIDIFRGKSELLTIGIHFGSSVAADPDGTVDDSVSDKVRVMADLHHFQTAASMEYPFPDMADALRDNHVRQMDAFEKCCIPQYSEGGRKMQFFESTIIKGFASDMCEPLRKLHRGEGFAPIKCPIPDSCK